MTPDLRAIEGLLDDPDAAPSDLVDALNHRGARDALMVRAARTGRLGRLGELAEGAAAAAVGSNRSPCGPMVVTAAVRWCTRGLTPTDLDRLARMPSYDPAERLASLIRIGAATGYPARQWLESLKELDVDVCLAYDAESYGRARSDYSPAEIGEMLDSPGAPGAACALEHVTSDPGLRRELLTQAAVSGRWEKLVDAGVVAALSAVRTPDRSVDPARMVWALGVLGAPGDDPRRQAALDRLRNLPERLRDPQLDQILAAGADPTGVYRYCLVGPATDLQADVDPLLSREPQDGPALPAPGGPEGPAR